MFQANDQGKLLPMQALNQNHLSEVLLFRNLYTQAWVYYFTEKEHTQRCHHCTPGDVTNVTTSYCFLNLTLFWILLYLSFSKIFPSGYLPLILWFLIVLKEMFLELRQNYRNFLKVRERFFQKYKRKYFEEVHSVTYRNIRSSCQWKYIQHKTFQVSK